MSAALARRADEAPLVEGEYLFMEADFDAIAALIYERAAIVLSKSKATLVYSRLAKRLRRLGLSTFTEYCALVSDPTQIEERDAMMASLTTNVTRFFREPHHFDHLRDNLIQPMASAIKAGRRVRIWSAGCSTGQEPYSIALTILSVVPDAHLRDVRILATDIDPNVVATAKAGVYADDLVSPVPDLFRQRWLEREGANAWKVGEAARALVAVRPLNLMENWPMKGEFDAIFCRNVVIYFDEPTQDRVFKRFAEKLVPGGRLYVGHSERVGYAGAPFTPDGLTTYRKSGGGK